MRRTALLLLLLAAAPAGAVEIRSPEAFLGHRVGADRKLAPWPKVLEYLRLVDAASPRVTIELAGRSTLDNEMPVVVVTSEANQANLPRLREIARRLHHPDGLAPAEAEALVAEGKAIVLVTCTIHSTEVGSTQMAMELVHGLATAEDPETRRWLDEVVLLLMPSINPDGQVLVVDWYEKWLGTPYEGGAMPWLYHHYVGHDDNRDFAMLTQKESQVVNDLLYHRWFPQVFLDEHQMGSVGPRMFVPPQTDPLDPEVHSLIFRQADLLGTAMSVRLEEAGKRGVGSNMIYDSYWIGGTRNTAWWKNVTGLLTEVASANVASPLHVAPEELRGGAKGLPEYGRRANYPSPWEGGWWRLRDIVEYELVATKALLETAATHRADLLRNTYRMAREAIERGASEPPYAFLVPPDQHDPVAAARLVELLLRHGVRVGRADRPFTAGRAAYPAGTYVVPAAQAYRPFLLTMLRPQRYPEVLPYAGGPVLPPYDVTSWSLPLAMGVAVEEAAEPLAERFPEVREPEWPGGEVAAGAGGWLIPHAADSAFTALNRLLAGGKRVYWLRQALPGGAAGGARGDLYVPADAATAAELSRLSREARVPVVPLAAAPQGPAYRVRPVRVGLYKPWVASMDEGWTRFLLERYGFPLESLDNAELRKGTFRGKVDVLLLPDVGKDLVEKGEPSAPEARRFWEPLPPPYAGGLGEEGSKQIKRWVEEGGTLVALDSAVEYALDLFALPARDVLAKVAEEEFHAPGSTLRVRLDPTHPIAYGLAPEEAIYFSDSPALETSPTDARFTRRLVATYPADARDILLSGYLKGGEKLERRIALVDFTVGKGRVVLFAFRPQHRAQTVRTLKLLWNALYLGRLEEVELP
ncbi:MAG TPA: M14 metallopeptidase family protein [Thermoanaerobaculia bacterium]|nr:M14 metallopeptidase family protein [Thermoanaerobaculia bacterium]